MPRLRIPMPIRSQILPEDRIALNRLKNNATIASPLIVIMIIIALDEFTPLATRRFPEPRKLRASAGAIHVYVDHEGRYSVGAAPPPAPVVVVHVMPGFAVALGAQALDEEVGAPALEGAGAVLDAFDGGVAVYEGYF